MNPGRELDALIAEKVMGLEPWPEQDPRWKYKAFKAPIVPYGVEPKPCAPPEYSTSIEAAWEVVEHIDLFFKLNKVHATYRSAFGNLSGSIGETAPHAICLAALKTVEGK